MRGAPDAGEIAALLAVIAAVSSASGERRGLDCH
ncbi:acyl-CoA carboxylase epsilon subunit [Streptomyces sp. SLBN-31]